MYSQTGGQEIVLCAYDLLLKAEVLKEAEHAKDKPEVSILPENTANLKTA